MRRTPKPAGHAAPNVIWRFYMDHNRRWRWQCLLTDHTVTAESQSGYKDYEECLADAQSKGYMFQPSQVKRGRELSD